MWIVLLLSLIGLYLVEYMIPFSRNVKWIENASQAYYKSYAWVEESVLQVYSWALGINHENFFTPWAMKDFEYDFIWSWEYIPAPGNGNAPWDSNYSILSQNEPISLSVWWKDFDLTWSEISIDFRVPDWFWIDSSWDNQIILLQLSGNWDSIFSASWSLITKSDVSWWSFNLLQEDGESLRGTGATFRNHYWDLWCDSSAVTDCTLRLSLIRPIFNNTSSRSQIPYLEYQINASQAIPYQNPVVSSRGKSFGFSKTLEVFIPQQATSSAFDFTVLQ